MTGVASAAGGGATGAVVAHGSAVAVRLFESALVCVPLAARTWYV